MHPEGGTFRHHDFSVGGHDNKLFFFPDRSLANLAMNSGTKVRGLFSFSSFSSVICLHKVKAYKINGEIY